MTVTLCDCCVLAVELDDARTVASQVQEENSALKTEVTQVQTQVHDKSEMVIDLQGTNGIKPYTLLVVTL